MLSFRFAQFYILKENEDFCHLVKYRIREMISKKKSPTDFSQKSSLNLYALVVLS